MTHGVTTMPEFEALMPGASATIEAVAIAVMKLRTYDESELAVMISSGQLHELFPFRPHNVQPTRDILREEEVNEASPLPLDNAEYARLVQSTMPPQSPRRESGQLVQSAESMRVRAFALESALEASLGNRQMRSNSSLTDRLKHRAGKLAARLKEAARLKQRQKKRKKVTQRTPHTIDVD